MGYRGAPLLRRGGLEEVSGISFAPSAGAASLDDLSIARQATPSEGIPSVPGLASKFIRSLQYWDS